MTTPDPSVFISYSWDDDAHKVWVRELAERLVANGVNTMLDQWHVHPGDSLTQFMEKCVTDCDHTLIVCTPNYRAKSSGRKGGVGYEQQIISGEIAGGIDRRKFIPIVAAGGFDPGDPTFSIPAHFQGIYAIDMRPAVSPVTAFESLLRAIYKVPAFSPPPLGSRPAFLSPAGSLSSAKAPLRLATIDLDGWELISGVVSNQMYPDTFEIPSEGTRQSISPGTFVKLMFEHAEPQGKVEIRGGAFVEAFKTERMWVEVTGEEGPYLTGKLSNVPAAGNDPDKLHYDKKIYFLPEHVINIASQDELGAEDEEPAPNGDDT